MRSYAFRATVTQFVNTTHIWLKNVSFSLHGVPVTRHPSQQGRRSTMLAFLLAIGLQVGGFWLGACVPDAFQNRFGRGRPFQIFRVDALNSRLHRIKHAPHQRGPGCQVFEKAFSLPFGHWSSSGGFPAGSLRSGCVLDQVRQRLAFSDIKG